MGRCVWLSVTWPAIVAEPGVGVGVGLGTGLLGVGKGDGTGSGVGRGDDDAVGIGVGRVRPDVRAGTAAFVASWIAWPGRGSERGATRWWETAGYVASGNPGTF